MITRRIFELCSPIGIFSIHRKQKAVKLCFIQKLSAVEKYKLFRVYDDIILFFVIVCFLEDFTKISNFYFRFADIDPM